LDYPICNKLFFVSDKISTLVMAGLMISPIRDWLHVRR